MVAAEGRDTKAVEGATTTIVPRLSVPAGRRVNVAGVGCEPTIVSVKAANGPVKMPLVGLRATVDSTPLMTGVITVGERPPRYGLVIGPVGSAEGLSEGEAPIVGV